MMGAQRQIQTREGAKKIYYGKPETLFLPGNRLHNGALCGFGPGRAAPRSRDLNPSPWLTVCGLCYPGRLHQRRR
jgi:hypothetical protein